MNIKPFDINTEPRWSETKRIQKRQHELQIVKLFQNQYNMATISDALW